MISNVLTAIFIIIVYVCHVSFLMFHGEDVLQVITMLWI